MKIPVQFFFTFLVGRIGTWNVNYLTERGYSHGQGAIVFASDIGI
jgi:hypothetical protein